MNILVIDGVVTDTEPRVAWAVGPEGGFGWMAIWAPTADAAADLWAELDTAGVTDPDTLVAERVERWDNLNSDPGTAEWIAAGFATQCIRCTENVDSENLGRIVHENQVLCCHCEERANA